MIKEIEFVFDIHHDETAKKLVMGDVTCVEFNDDPSYVQTYCTSGTKVFDQEGIKLMAKQIPSQFQKKVRTYYFILKIILTKQSMLKVNHYT